MEINSFIEELKKLGITPTEKQLLWIINSI